MSPLSQRSYSFLLDNYINILSFLDIFLPLPSFLFFVLNFFNSGSLKPISVNPTKFVVLFRSVVKIIDEKCCYVAFTFYSPLFRNRQYFHHFQCLNLIFEEEYLKSCITTSSICLYPSCYDLVVDSPFHDTVNSFGKPER